MRNDKLSPADAIRAYCMQCLGMKHLTRKTVEGCQGDQAFCGPCPFFPFRMGKRPTVRVFRTHCLHCTRGDRFYIAECPASSCPAYPYRLGINPAREGIGIISNLPNQGREWAFQSLESIFSPQDDAEVMSKEVRAK